MTEKVVAVKGNAIIGKSKTVFVRKAITVSVTVSPIYAGFSHVKPGWAEYLNQRNAKMPPEMTPHNVANINLMLHCADHGIGRKARWLGMPPPNHPTHR